MQNFEVYIRPNLSCDFHRLQLPYQNLECKPKVPIYIFNRIPPDTPDILKRLRKLGFKIICDIDDYWFLDKSHYLYEHLSKSNVPNRIIESLKFADAVTTTTAALADRIKEHNKNIYVIPNALPFDSGQFQKSRDKESDTPFIYVGGASHQQDLAIIKDCSDKLTIAGYSFDPEWWKIKQANKGAMFKDELPLASYMEAYEGHRFALAPLVDNPFNNCKSNLKVLEAGCKGLPIITSKCLPYYNPIDNSAVIYANNRYEWQYHMRKLMAYPMYAEDRGAALAEHVREHYSLYKANTIRRQLIESFR